MKVLETPRLIVRHLRPDDLDEFYAVTSDQEVMRYVDHNEPLSRAAAQEWLEECLDHYQTIGYGCSALIYKPNGEFAGLGGLGPSPDSSGEIELIYILKKAYWGVGLAGELAQTALEFGFWQLGLKRIIAAIDPKNTPSIHIAEKLGMQYERLGVDEYGLPTAYYALERS